MRRNRLHTTLQRRGCLRTYGGARDRSRGPDHDRRSSGARRTRLPVRAGRGGGWDVEPRRSGTRSPTGRLKSTETRALGSDGPDGESQADAPFD